MNEFNTAEQFLKQAPIINRSQENLRGYPPIWMTIHVYIEVILMKAKFN